MFATARRLATVILVLVYSQAVRAQVIIIPGSAANNANLVNGVGSHFGELGNNLVNSGTPVHLAKGLNTAGATVKDGQGNLHILVNADYGNNPDAIMIIALHEQAHADLGHDPEANLSPQEVACQEADAICRELGAYDDYASWATDNGKKKLKCSMLGESKASFRKAWEACNQNWYGGDPAPGCPGSGTTACEGE